MWAASVFVAIAFVGSGFMVWFLVGLLREGAPSVCYWVVPAIMTPGVRMASHGVSNHGMILHAISEDGREEQNSPSAEGQELLENGIYVQEDSGSNLVSLDVRPPGAGVGGRAINHSGARILREHRL